MMADFLLRAFAAGAGVALVAGPLGCFVAWRRMAYFGDTLAHAALLGVALGLLLGIDPALGVLVVCAAVAVILVLLQRTRRIAVDTLLGILAHGGLALGLVALAFLEGVRVDLMGYLFGDVLAVTSADLALIYSGAAVVAVLLAVLWRPLLAVTVHEDLARVEGAPVAVVGLAFTLLIAIVVAVAMKVVGILLVTSLLIVPAGAARRFARTPEAMALLAAAIGVGAVAAGLAGSLAWDTPAGPSIVVAAVAAFAAGSVIAAVAGALVSARG
jgi:zinc transport system permease protein